MPQGDSSKKSGVKIDKSKKAPATKKKPKKKSGEN